MQKVMIKGGGCLKPKCLSVTSIQKVMIIGCGCMKPRVSKCHQYTKGDDHRWWMHDNLDCLNVTSIRKVMIIGVECVKP